MSRTMTFQAEISSAVAPPASPSLKERGESILENYTRQQDKVLEVSEGLCALQELLRTDPVTELKMSESGRNGLAFIMGKLFEELGEVYGMTVEYEIGALLEDAEALQKVEV